ncbi:Cold and drought-regulated protein CORA [Heracleum sosnowskyi]|uniref:Cold and drought-regulated protein CORA n=1 Tax=Heracleum sosnowskyi TaxID=360622 RepID=A0AAD8LYA1_9APIA|nr:Cold and drought-regulated protein CORA [Heracleum sosnowskyi]
MGSKIFLLLGLSIAFALLISSEVAARDLAETTTKPEGYHGGGYNNGGGYHNGGGGGYHNGGGGYHNGGGGYNNGGGYHNGGGHYNGGGHHGGGCYHYCHGRCCSAAEESALKATEVKPQN